MGKYVLIYVFGAYEKKFYWFTVESVLCGLCRERPLILNDRFHRHTLWVDYDLYTCYEGPPVLRDNFCWAEEVVSQDRFSGLLYYTTFPVSRNAGQHFVNVVVKNIHWY